MIRLALVLSVLAGGGNCLAQGKPDFGKAVEYLQRLGLPDVSGAEFVIFPGDVQGYGIDYLDNPDLLIGGWLLPSKGDEKQIVMRGGVRRVGGEYAEEYEKADLSESLKKIEEHLDAYIEESQSEEGRFYFSGGESGGETLLFLVSAYSSGEKVKANELIGKVMIAAGSSSAPVQEAIRIMASTQYSQAISEMLEDGDWKKLDSGVRSIQKKFGVIWPNGPACDLLLESVALRLSGDPPNSIEGEGVTPELSALAEELAGISDGEELDFSLLLENSLWVLDKGEETEIGNGWISKVTGRRMAAVPLLIAMLDDPYPIQVDASELNEYGDLGEFGTAALYRRRMMAMGEGEPTPESLLEGMRRPATRGDVAAALLTLIVPSPDPSEAYNSLAALGALSGSAPSDNLKKSAEEWYESHKDLDQEKIALAYFENGSELQQSESIDILLGSDSSEVITVIEKRLMERVSDEPYGDSLAAMYIRERGKEAKDFFDRYKEAVLSSDLDDGFGREEGEIRDYQMRVLNQLEQFVDQRDLDEVLEDIASGKVELRTVGSVLQSGLQELELAEAELKLVRSAASCKDPETAMSLIGAVRILLSEGEPLEFDLNSASAEYWAVLAEDMRTGKKIPGESGQTVSEVAAAGMEMLYQSEGGESIQYYSFLDVEGAREISKRRMVARLNGEQLPEVPDLSGADSAEAQKEAWEAFTKLPAEGIGEALAAWEPKQRFSLAYKLYLSGRTAEELEIAEDVKKVSIKINKVAPEAEGLAKSGTEIDRAALEAMIGQAKEWAREGEAKVILVNRNKLFGGIEISVEQLEPDYSDCSDQVDRMMVQLSPEEVAPGSAAFVAAIGNRSYISWPAGESGEPKTEQSPPEEEKPEDDDLLPEAEGRSPDRYENYREQSFWAATDEWLKGGLDHGSDSQIAIYSVPLVAVERLMADEEESE